MRTTLTIDDDLAGILKRNAREMDKSFKELVNSALRKGLAESSASSTPRFSARPHDFGATHPSLDLDRMNQMVDELDVEDYLRKAARDDSAGH